MKHILCSLVVVLATVLPSSAQSILVCTFEKSALVSEESPGQFSAEVDSNEPIVLESVAVDSETIILAGLDSASPVLRGNLGESKLEVLRRTQDIIWLAEKPPLGGVNIYTVFSKLKTVIESKQLYFLGTEPLGMIAIGKCK